MAELLPGRAEFGGVVTNLLSEIERYGVAVETGVEATEDMIADRSPDVVVVATGATPHLPDPEWFEGAHVVTAWDVLRGDAEVGGTWWCPTGAATGSVPGWPSCSGPIDAATFGWP